MSTSKNIPIYRAKKIDSDEFIEFESKFTYKNITYAVLRWSYGEVSGYLNEVLFPITHKIDPNTLAIHFQNTFREKIFFGINTYLGGDEVEAEFLDGTPFKGIALFNGYECRFYDKNDDWVKISSLKNIKAIRIHKGIK